MATITVNNLTIQLDLNNSHESVVEFFERVNEVLLVNFPTEQPQIFTSGIDCSDIVLVDGRDEEEFC